MKYIVGDILTPNTDDKAVIVCHQVNCQGVMGAGLAKQVKRMYPDVFELYKEKCSQIAAGIGGVGDVQFCCVLSSSGYIIANIFGQDRYGRDRQYTDYNGLKKAFEKIAVSFPHYTIRIPYMMGCGLGGGDWSIVKKIIEDTLELTGINVEIWSLKQIKV